MEEDRIEVPLYGQVEACVKLQAAAPKDAEFYVVVQGSALTHVTRAKRGADALSLSFIVPGHALAEAAALTSFCCAGQQIQPCVCDGSSVTYLRDAAQEAAEYLRANREQPGPPSYLEALQMFSRWTADPGRSPGPAALGQLDEKMARAAANMDYLQQWDDADTRPGAEAAEPKETLLHLAGRLGLVHLARHLTHRMRGQRAATSAGQDGEMPPELAQKNGLRVKFGELSVPRCQCVRRLWSDGSCALGFFPGSDQVTLTVRRTAGSRPEEAIMILRDKLGDESIVQLMDGLKADGEFERRSDGFPPAQEGTTEEDLQAEEHAAADDVFQEHLVLCLDDDDNFEESLSVNGHAMQSGESQCAAEAPPTAASSDETPEQQSQLEEGGGGSGGEGGGGGGEEEDDHRKYTIRGVTEGSTATESEPWEAADSEDASPPPSGADDPQSPPSSPLLSPADRALARLSRSTSCEPSVKRESPPTMDTCDLSLVALEVDSEEDVSADATKDKDGDVRPAPDLTCTRSQSASTPCATATKEPAADQGIRLRSYSYSKISLRPARFARDSPATDPSSDAALHSATHGRSLLQALSLSKSLSLLHPGKQRPPTVISEQLHEKREAGFRKRAQSADDDGSAALAESLQHLTLSEFLKEIEEEELDKYSIPAKTESEKYKVIRTFSFLKSRMSSTRNKTKGKGKEKEKDREANGHRFSAGACLGSVVCMVCDKQASGKELLHCAGCTAIVHKSCKDSLPPCLKKVQDKYAVASVKSRTASLPQNFTVRDSSHQALVPPPTSLPAVTPKERRDPGNQSGSPSGSVPNSDSSETESDACKVNGRSEELLQTPGSSTSTDSSFGDDGVDSSILSDLAVDAADYEAESWSLAVEHKFCKKQDKRAVKRQDVIYELMQTELHHLQTLHVMAEVFRRGMKREVQLDVEAVERVFPCLDQLLAFHRAFFGAMKERRLGSAQPPGHRNYLVQRVGDVLLQQFTDENREKMKQVYGEFCSRHNGAVGFFKELQQHNKRFQNFIKQQGNNSLVKRREIPECILLVTQRITKYPVLLERILQYTEEGTEEHADLSQALCQVREVIAAVDLSVSEYERHQRLQEVCGRMENRSAAKLKNGHTFRKQDMMRPGQALKHQGVLLWKSATGRLKDVLALLLTDTLIFLQDKDQKYTFAAVDQKPPVIALQKLIVREVANQEKGMFLISASAAGPEMYEVHTSSKEERNAWMRLIREAVESCPEEEEEYTSESEEEKRAAEARVQKIHKLQESLASRDQLICSSLEEKLQVYAALSALSGRTDGLPVGPQLLVQPQWEEPPQAAALLAAAVKEAENLKATLSPGAVSPSSLSPRSDTDSVFLSSPAPPVRDVPDHESPPENSAAELPEQQRSQINDMDLKVAQSVQSLTQLLYSLQATVAIQDSCYEVQRLLLRESGRPSPRAQRQHLPSIRGSTLQEQEKQRNLEKQKEEMVAVQRLQEQLRQERERWDRECRARESQRGELASRLEERERRCHLEAERLRRERRELDEQLEEYQQGLERLREGQRNVEKERERLESQQKLLQTWRHGRQRSLPTVIPHMVIPLDGQQEPEPGEPGEHDAERSLFVNEAAFVNRRHKRNDPSAHNCLNTLLARSSSRRSPGAQPPCGPQPDPGDWVMGTGCLYSAAGRLELQHSAGDRSTHGYVVGEAWSPTGGGADRYRVISGPGDPPLDLDALVGNGGGGGEEGGEETIVYL